MKVLIAGDFCPQFRVAEAFENGNYQSVLGEVEPLVKEADCSLVNFECPITNGRERPIQKQGPNLQSSESGMKAVKWVGFDTITLANNHFMDFGEEGAYYTLDICRQLGIDVVGGGISLAEASDVLYKKLPDGVLAIINCCEHEFSIATDKSPGSNPLNPIQQYYAIREARQNADYVLIIVHGGHEHFQLPSPRMQQTYRFFIDIGADAVVNHHQHCFSGYEVYKNKPILYGLGNFCFDMGRKMPDTWYEGLICMIDFSDKVGFKLIPYRQCDELPSVFMKPDDPAIIKKIDILNDVISNNEKLNQAIENYYMENMRSIASVFEPIRNRYVLGAQRRGWLPLFLSKKQKLMLKNYIFCEAHNDKLKFYLDN